MRVAAGQRGDRRRGKAGVALKELSRLYCPGAQQGLAFTHEKCGEVRTFAVDDPIANACVACCRLGHVCDEASRLGATHACDTYHCLQRWEHFGCVPAVQEQKAKVAAEEAVS